MEHTSAKCLLKHNHVSPQTTGPVTQVFIVSPSSTLCMSRMFISVLPHKENKLHPIYRTIKSQDNSILKARMISILFISLTSGRSGMLAS